MDVLEVVPQATGWGPAAVGRDKALLRGRPCSWVLFRRCSGDRGHKGRKNRRGCRAPSTAPPLSSGGHCFAPASYGHGWSGHGSFTAVDAPAGATCDPLWSTQVPASSAGRKPEGDRPPGRFFGHRRRHCTRAWPQSRRYPAKPCRLRGGNWGPAAVGTG